MVNTNTKTSRFRRNAQPSINISLLFSVVFVFTSVFGSFGKKKKRFFSFRFQIN